MQPPNLGYLIEALTSTNFVLIWLPMPLTAVMITMLMLAAMRQYSIAVAPHSSSMNRASNRRIENSCRRFPEILPRHTDKS
jgi:hypothetical protein